MTSEPKQKKVKTELDPTSNATVNIQTYSNKIPGALIDGLTVIFFLSKFRGKAR